MNKIKDTVLDNLKTSGVTNAQVSVFIVLSRYQEDNGLVRGAYYKEVCDESYCSYPTFYSAIRGLEEKGLIKVIQNDGDWDILIMNNDFTNQEAAFAGGYLNTNHDIFFNEEFFKMTVIEKLLVMDLMRKCQKNSKNGGKYHKNLEEFYGDYCVMFQKYGKTGKLTKRVLQLCMKTLKKYFNIGVYDKKYWISPKKDKIYVKEQFAGRTEEKNLKNHLGKMLCRRKKLTYTPDALQDTVNLLNTFKEHFKEKKMNPVESLLKAIQFSLEEVNKEVDNISKWTRKLVPALVNKMMTERILGFAK